MKFPSASKPVTMPDIEREVLALVESVAEIDGEAAREARPYVEIGEHGIALAELVAWALRSQRNPT